MGTKPLQSNQQYLTVFDLFPSVMKTKVEVNPYTAHHRSLRGRGEIFTDEEREIASKFNVGDKLEEVLQSISRWYKIPLDSVSQIKGGTVSLESLIMQTHCLTRDEAESVLRSGRGIGNDVELGIRASGKSDYFWYLRRIYEFPISYLVDVDNGRLTIEEALVLAYGFSAEEAEDIRWGRLNLTQALAKRKTLDGHL